MRLNKVIALAMVFCLVSTTAVFACHSTYFDEIFTKVQKANLDKAQIAQLFQLQRNFVSADHRKGLCDRQHDRAQNQVQFVAAAAGILDDAQFKAILGKEKTEVQKLRFEVNQMKKDLAEIKAMLRELQSRS